MHHKIVFLHTPKNDRHQQNKCHDSNSLRNIVRKCIPVVFHSTERTTEQVNVAGFDSQWGRLRSYVQFACSPHFCEGSLCALQLLPTTCMRGLALLQWSWPRDWQKGLELVPSPTATSSVCFHCSSMWIWHAETAFYWLVCVHVTKNFLLLCSIVEIMRTWLYPEKQITAYCRNWQCTTPFTKKFT